MTSYLRDLGRRAVACPRWRWRRGMIVDLNTGQQTLVVRALDDATWISTTVGWFFQEAWARLDPNPDLSDPATRGCLLALVREAWQDAGIAYCYPVADGWHVVARGRVLAWGIIEADALVAALEDAP